MSVFIRRLREFSGFNADGGWIGCEGVLGKSCELDIFFMIDIYWVSVSNVIYVLKCKFH